MLLDSLFSMDAITWVTLRKSILGQFYEAVFLPATSICYLKPISYRFLHEATFIISYRFLFEATGGASAGKLRPHLQEGTSAVTEEYCYCGRQTGSLG
jgi:hypothetical protein